MNSRHRVDLLPLVSPCSVAVIGASPDLSRYPGKILDSLRRWGFTGRVYPVNPKYEKVFDWQCYADISQIPEAADVALITLAAAKVPTALRAAIDAGARSAVVFASGMAEAGEEGLELQEDVRQMSVEAGIPVLGPNTLGLVNVLEGIPLSGAAALQRHDMPAGGVGIVAQSGGLMGSLLDRGWAHGVGFSRAFATGNEVSVTAADCLQFLASDPGTRTIALFIEAVRDVPGFVSAARLAAAEGKPVFVLKVGRSEQAQRVAATHTAALAGSAAAWDALFDDLGIIRVNDLDELFTTTGMVDSCPPPGTDAIAVAGPSGGLAGLSADLCERHGIPLAHLASRTLEEISKLQAGFGHAGNPLDITGQVVSSTTWWMTRRLYELLLDDPSVGMLVIGQPTSQYASQAAEDIIGLSREASKPVVALWTGRHAIADALATLREARVATFEQPDLCYQTVRRFLDVPVALLRGSRPRETRIEIDVDRAARAREIFGRAGGTALPEHAAKNLLAEYGIPVPAGVVTTDVHGALKAAVGVGFPVALKAHGAGVLHKSDKGGVVIDIGDEEELAEAFTKVRLATETTEVLIESMVPPGVELFASVHRDPQVGSLLTLGFGGVNVEVLNDHVTALLPIEEKDVQALLDRLRGASLLNGQRGGQAVDRLAVGRILVGLCALASELGPSLGVIEVNPIIAHHSGAVAVDAVMTEAEQ
jgi:acetate---CoA ligase (ADP-forming)